QAVAALLQEAPQRVHHDESAEVTDVSIVVNRGSTGIHADQVIFQRMERLDFCGQRVKELKRHRVFACRWRIFDCRGLREKGSTGLRNHEGNRGVGWATSLSKGWTLGRRRRRA